MNGGVVEGRIILRGDAVERSLLAGPFRHPEGPCPLACWLISRRSLPTAYCGRALLCRRNGSRLTSQRRRLLLLRGQVRRRLPRASHGGACLRSRPDRFDALDPLTLRPHASSLVTSHYGAGVVMSIPGMSSMPAMAGSAIPPDAETGESPWPKRIVTTVCSPSGRKRAMP